MEFIADCFASRFLLTYLLNLQGIPFKQLFRYSLFVIESLFHFDKGSGEWSMHLFEGTHPPTQFRSVAAVSSLTNLALAEEVISENEAKLEIILMMESALRGYELVTGKKRQKSEGVEYAKLLSTVGDISLQMIRHHRTLFPNTDW